MDVDHVTLMRNGNMRASLPSWQETFGVARRAVESRCGHDGIRDMLIHHYSVQAYMIADSCDSIRQIVLLDPYALFIRYAIYK